MALPNLLRGAGRAAALLAFALAGCATQSAVAPPAG